MKGHWYHCFWIPVMSALRLNPGWDASLAFFVPCMQWIPQIHLWCDGCWPLLFHVPVCVHSDIGRTQTLASWRRFNRFWQKRVYQKILVGVHNGCLWKRRRCKPWKICLQNDIAEIHSIMNRSKWSLSLYSIFRDGWDIDRFKGVQCGGLHKINKPKISADEQCQTSFKFNKLC